MVNSSSRITRVRKESAVFFTVFQSLGLGEFSFNSLAPATVRGYFGPGIDKATLGLILNWGPIVGVCFFPVQSYVLQQRNATECNPT